MLGSKRFTQKNKDDLALVRRWKSGDESALEELLARYRSKILYSAVRIMRNFADGEEAAADAYVAIARGLKRFRGQSSVSSWIYIVSYRCACLALRRRARIHECSLIDLTLVQQDRALSDYACEQASLEAKEQLEEIAAACSRVIHGEELWLHIAHELTSVEIAALRGCSVPAIKSKLMRGSAQLRKRVVGWA